MNAFLSVLHSTEHRRHLLSRGGGILDREGEQRGVPQPVGEMDGALAASCIQLVSGGGPCVPCVPCVQWNS